jgi:hypothetical protein
MTSPADAAALPSGRRLTEGDRERDKTMNESNLLPIEAVEQNELEQVKGGLSWGEWAGVVMASVGLATGAPLLVYAGDKLSGVQ